MTLNTQMQILKKLSELKSAVSELESLINRQPIGAQKPARNGYLVEASEVLDIYRPGSDLVRWTTCAVICNEMGIEPSRGNCSSIGSTLKGAGFPRRRSQGRVLYNLPKPPPMY